MLILMLALPGTLYIMPFSDFSFFSASFGSKTGARSMAFKFIYTGAPPKSSASTIPNWGEKRNNTSLSRLSKGTIVTS